MLALQALAYIERPPSSRRAHTELCHRIRDTLERARQNAVNCAPLQTEQSEQWGDFSHQEKRACYYKLLEQDWIVYIFIKICSFNSIFHLQLLKIIKLTIFKLLNINGHEKVYEQNSGRRSWYPALFRALRWNYRGFQDETGS